MVSELLETEKKSVFLRRKLACLVSLRSDKHFFFTLAKAMRPLLLKGDPRKTQRFQKLITFFLFVAESSFFPKDSSKRELSFEKSLEEIR